MCIIMLMAVSFIFFGYLLPLIFILYLIAIVFWAEHSFASVLEEIDVVQDDVDISHPPDIPLFRFFSRHLVVNQPGHFDLHPLFGLVCLSRQ
ncbi:hypothetical protein JOM56_011857 [Amanita muscaria]